MKLSEIYQSKFLSAADIEETSITIRLTSIGVSALKKLRGAGEENKITADFEIENGDGNWTKHSKQFVIGRQNAKAIAKVLGEDTDDWIGRTLVLGKTMTQFGDSIVIQQIT